MTTRKVLRADAVWAVAWFAGTAVVVLWNAAFLESAAFDRLLAALGHTLALGAGSVAIATVLGWTAGSAFYFLETRGRLHGYAALTFAVNMVRSIPQVIGVLLVYLIVSFLIEREMVTTALAPGTLIACGTAVFICIEMSDLIRDRISHFAQSDFVAAMLVCGVTERRIVHIEILWRNCRSLILYKATALLGVTLFLLCSVDFIVSVGLSADVQAVNMPATLGNVLARLDSKQDILMLGVAIARPAEWASLFFRHLQGLSAAFLLVFSLLSIHHIVRHLHRRLQW
jgi:ABC-type dipeptide/oligopeptide/nickel transport system permease subunit